MIKTGAILEGLKTLSDGTLKVSFALNEIPSECAAEIIKFHRQFGWLLFSPTEILDVPKEPPREFKADKSPSQRLRAVLFVKYQQAGNLDLTFDEFYRSEMERYISDVKATLDQ